MTITRTVGGLAGPQEISFELTAQELYAAYLEVSKINDKEDVLNFIEDTEDEDLQSLYGCTREEALANVKEIAAKYRDYVEDGDYFSVKLEHAIKDFFKNP